MNTDPAHAAGHDGEDELDHDPLHITVRGYVTGFVLAVLSALCGFGLIWHMWPLAAASFATLIVATIVHTFNYDREFYIAADEVVRTEDTRTRLLASHV